MDDIRVKRNGKLYEVEMPDMEKLRINAKCVEDTANELQIDAENVAKIRAIMENVNPRITWGKFTEIFNPILKVVSPELLISHMIELPEYILDDADLLFESVLEEYSGTFE